MKRRWARAIEFASEALEPDEREAVRGDFAECGIDGSRALIEIAGLVVRRQATLWMDWRPWAALLGVVIPLGMLLSLLCRWWSETAAIDAFVYLHNGSFTYFSFPGWRHDVARAIAQNGLDGLALAYWSGMAGFVIGSLSRRAVWINGALLPVVVFGEFFAVDQPHGRFNHAVFAVPLYNFVLPFIVRAAFVVVPALLGARIGRRPAGISLARASALAFLMVGLTAVEIQGIQFAAILGWWRLDGLVYGAGFIQPGWHVRLLPLLLLWPALYIVATSRSPQSPRRAS